MVKLNKIYTRTGDDGTSGLVDGSRVSKSSPRMAAIGDVDEANSALGLAIAHLGDHPLTPSLLRIQNELFDLGADLATPVTDEADSDWALRMIPAQSTRLEREIDTGRHFSPTRKRTTEGCGRRDRPPCRARHGRTCQSRAHQSSRRDVSEPPVGPFVCGRAFGCGG